MINVDYDDELDSLIDDFGLRTVDESINVDYDDYEIKSYLAKLTAAVGEVELDEELYNSLMDDVGYINFLLNKLKNDIERLQKDSIDCRFDNLAEKDYLNKLEAKLLDDELKSDMLEEELDLLMDELKNELEAKTGYWWNDADDYFKMERSYIKEELGMLILSPEGKDIWKYWKRLTI